MRALNLMVDIDEVIFPIGDSVHLISHEFGLHDNSEPWRNWSAHQQYGCHPDEWWPMWTIFAERGGYINTPPIPGRVEALRHLYLDGHTINLVTARGFMQHADEIRTWTAQWLEEFAVPHHRLVFARDKVAAQAETGAYDLAVDDSPKNYEHLLSAGVNVWLQTHTHNEAYEAECRVDDLWQFAKIAERLS